MDMIRTPNQPNQAEIFIKQYVRRVIRQLLCKRYFHCSQTLISDSFFLQYHEIIDKQIIITYEKNMIKIKVGFDTTRKGQRLSRTKSIRNYLQYCYLIKQMNRLISIQRFSFILAPNGSVYMIKKISYAQILANQNYMVVLNMYIFMMQEYFCKHENIIKSIILSEYEHKVCQAKTLKDQNKQQSPLRLKQLFQKLRYQRQKSTKIDAMQYFQSSKEQIENCFKFVTTSFKIQQYMSDIKQLHLLKEEILLQQKPKKILDEDVQKGKNVQVNLKAIVSAINQLKIIKQKQYQINPGSHSNMKIYKCAYTLQPSVNAMVNDQKCKKKKYQSQLVKKSPKNFQQKTPAYNSFLNQYCVIMHLRNQQCPFICKYYLYSVEKKSIYLEFHKMRLRKFLREEMKQPSNQKKYTITMKLELMKGIASAIYFLQFNKVLHRDLKPQNILLDKNLMPKIIDFGSSCGQEEQGKVLSVQDDRLLSTQGYFYPYDKCSQQIKKLYDIWGYEKHLHFDSYSLGVIVQQLFQLNKNSQNLAQKGSLIVQYLNYIRDRCTDPNPDDRLSAQQIVAILILLLKFQKEQRMSPQR